MAGVYPQYEWRVWYVRLHESCYDGLIPVDSTTSKFKAWKWRVRGYRVATIYKPKEKECPSTSQ